MKARAVLSAHQRVQEWSYSLKADGLKQTNHISPELCPSGFQQIESGALTNMDTYEFCCYPKAGDGRQYSAEKRFQRVLA